MDTVRNTGLTPELQRLIDTAPNTHTKLAFQMLAEAASSGVIKVETVTKEVDQATLDRIVALEGKLTMLGLGKADNEMLEERVAALEETVDAHEKRQDAFSRQELWPRAMLDGVAERCEQVKRDCEDLLQPYEQRVGAALEEVHTRIDACQKRVDQAYERVDSFNGTVMTATHAEFETLRGGMEMLATEIKGIKQVIAALGNEAAKRRSK